MIPNKAWELLENTLLAVESLELDDRYIVTTEYEYQMFHCYVEQMDKTAVSFSGALMAIVDKIAPDRTVSPTEYSNDVFNKLLAIDLMSNFEVYHGLELLYRDTYKLPLCSIVSEVVHFGDIISYLININGYKARLEFLITQLKAYNL